MGYLIVLIIILFVFLMVCIGFGLAGGLLYLLYIPFKKRLLSSGRLDAHKSRLINRVYIGVLLLVAVQTTWTAFFPTDSFYINEFEYNTGLEFPKSGKVIVKDSSYPDHHGDYWAAAVVELEQDDFQKIYHQIKSSKKFEVDTSQYGIGTTKDFNNLIKDYPLENVEITYADRKSQWFKIAFYNDRKTIIFERSSS